MKRLLIIIPILLSFSYVFADSCAERCTGLGYDYYSCWSGDNTGTSYCTGSDDSTFCHHTFTEVFGTDCALRCWCHEDTRCGYGTTECSSACSSTGCSGTTLDITSISERPSDTFFNDWSTWDVIWDNTGGIGIWTKVECHVRSPTGINYYPSHGCSWVYSGSPRIAEEQIQVNEVGTWELLSCSVYEAQGDTVCSIPYIYRDEYDLDPVHTWEVTSSDCPPTTFGQCTSGENGFLQCFVNHIGECEYYPILGLYCWTDFRDCETFYSPPRYCSSGACIEYGITTTTTTTVPITTTTTVVTTTTVEQDLGEPFDTQDQPQELQFLKSLGSGLFSLSGSIVGGLLLLVFALAIAGVIIAVGKRSLV